MNGFNTTLSVVITVSTAPTDKEDARAVLAAWLERCQGDLCRRGCLPHRLTCAPLDVLSISTGFLDGMLPAGVRFDYPGEDEMRALGQDPGTRPLAGSSGIAQLAPATRRVVPL